MSYQQTAVFTNILEAYRAHWWENNSLEITLHERLNEKRLMNSEPELIMTRNCSFVGDMMKELVMLPKDVVGLIREYTQDAQLDKPSFIRAGYSRGNRGNNVRASLPFDCFEPGDRNWGCYYHYGGEFYKRFFGLVDTYQEETYKYIIIHTLTDHIDAKIPQCGGYVNIAVYIYEKCITERPYKIEVVFPRTHVEEMIALKSVAEFRAILVRLRSSDLVKSYNQLSISSPSHCLRTWNVWRCVFKNIAENFYRFKTD
jgi:hypothetical protein